MVKSASAAGILSKKGMNTLTSTTYDPKNLPADFVKIYGGSEKDVQVYSSPARINIIGEHIDYNGGKVFPAAINKYLYVAIRKRGDSKIIYNDIHFPGTFEFDIPYSRQQLADFLAVERSGLSAALGKLRREGLLDFNREHFILKI